VSAPQPEPLSAEFLQGLVSDLSTQVYGSALVRQMAAEILDLRSWRTGMKGVEDFYEVREQFYAAGRELDRVRTAESAVRDELSILRAQHEASEAARAELRDALKLALSQRDTAEESVAALTHNNTSIQTELAGVKEKLRTAGAKFREYEKLHRDKAAELDYPMAGSTAVSERNARLSKAEHNAEMARLCEEASGPAPAPSKACDCSADAFNQSFSDHIPHGLNCPAREEARA
jgi:chromosome segregation ATPase